jgi:hypothetical protein
MGDIPQEKVNKWVDKLSEKNGGDIDLYPKFNDNYYEQLK